MSEEEHRPEDKNRHLHIREYLYADGNQYDDISQIKNENSSNRD